MTSSPVCGMGTSKLIKGRPGRLLERDLEGGWSPSSRAFFIDILGPFPSVEIEEFCNKTWIQEFTRLAPGDVWTEPAYVNVKRAPLTSEGINGIFIVFNLIALRHSRI